MNIILDKKNNLLLEPYVKNFLNPKYVFIPVLKGAKLKVKDNTYVYKDDIIMINKEGMSIHSSISGTVLGVKDMMLVMGKTPCLVIENDFKESIRTKKNTKKFINDYTKEDFMRVLEDTSIYHKDYIYKKFKTPNSNLIINGVESEPLFGNKYFLLKDNITEILDTIDLMSELFHYEHIVLAIKNTYSDIIEAFSNELGTYPNIDFRLINDDYPNGINEYLKDIIGLSDTDIFEISEICDIYHALKKEVPASTKLITISGNAVEPRSVVRVKKGTLLSEVFTNNFDFTNKNVDVYLNGIMSGNLVNTMQYVIDDDIEGVLIMKSVNHAETECINCGLCHKSCPRGLDPKYVFDHKGKVKNEYKDTCLQCGLCNYVCPANRNLKKYMGEIK